MLCIPVFNADETAYDGLFKPPILVGVAAVAVPVPFPIPGFVLPPVPDFVLLPLDAPSPPPDDFVNAVAGLPGAGV